MKKFTLRSKNTVACVMALGFFDGVHLGHRTVIEKAVSEAKLRSLCSGVFTFTESAGQSKKTRDGEIYDIEKRLTLIEELGVDFALVPDFNDFASLSAEQFIKTLVEDFSVSAVVCGEDFRFGKGASGNTALLKEFSKQYGFEVFIVPAVELEGEKVSSSAIRAALKNGDVEKANRMLGKPFSINGEVVSGEHIGSKKLYPTINQTLTSGFVLKRGVYATHSVVDGQKLSSVTNIGVCPTVKEEGTQLAAETYILDSTLNLYGKSVEVVFAAFLRDEIKFASISQLKAQITNDIEKAREIFDK